MKLKIGLDIDDVVFPFNSIAVDLANQKYHKDLTLDDITSWANTGKASVIKEFYSDETLYKRQEEEVYAINVDIVNNLNKVADVYFITAVSPDFMTHRAHMIQHVFPNINVDQIILGAAKSLVHFDIILDDCIDNVLDSKATYPVLMRKPWNKDMTGLLSVNNLREFESLVQHIIHKEDAVERKIPRVIALVGPSGSNKSQIQKQLAKKYNSEFEIPTSYSSKRLDKYSYLPNFSKESFFEHTFYAGIEYGTKYEDIKKILDSGRNAVMVLDICGAIGMKQAFPTSIVYVNRKKENIVMDILSSDMTDKEKMLRILSLNAEKKNADICDYIVDGEKYLETSDFIASTEGF